MNSTASYYVNWIPLFRDIAYVSVLPLTGLANAFLHFLTASIFKQNAFQSHAIYKYLIANAISDGLSLLSLAIASLTYSVKLCPWPKHHYIIQLVEFIFQSYVIRLFKSMSILFSCTIIVYRFYFVVHRKDFCKREKFTTLTVIFIVASAVYCLPVLGLKMFQEYSLLIIVTQNLPPLISLLIAIPLNIRLIYCRNRAAKVSKNFKTLISKRNAGKKLTRMIIFLTAIFSIDQLIVLIAVATVSYSNNSELLQNIFISLFFFINCIYFLNIYVYYRFNRFYRHKFRKFFKLCFIQENINDHVMTMESFS